MLNTYQDIADYTQELLLNNKGWESRYNDYLEDIVNGKEQLIKEAKTKFRVKSPFSRYTSIGNVIRNTNNNKVCFDWRFRGHSIGTIIVSNDNVSTFLKQSGIMKALGGENSNVPIDMKKIIEIEEEYDWNSGDISKLRSYLKNYEVKTIDSEHELELILLRKFSTKVKSKKPMYNIQPIKLFKDYLQIVTPLSASKIKDGELRYCVDKKGYDRTGGGIDILARSNSEIYVIELKDEYKKNEKPTDAIKQAIVYSTFVRELIRNPKANKNDNSWYHDIFKIRTEIPKSLCIHAMVAMPRKPNSKSSVADKNFSKETLVLKGHGYEDKIKLDYLYFNVDGLMLSDFETSSTSIKINTNI